MRIVNGIEVLDDIEELVAPEHTAIIVVDMQNTGVSEQGPIAAKGVEYISHARSIIPRIQRLLSAARSAGVLVLYAEVAHRDRRGIMLWDGPSYYYAGPNPRIEFDIREGTWEAQTIDELAPQDGDIIFSKYRFSAFAGTCLDMVLRGHGIRSLVITGTGTSGCITHTFSAAQNGGYYPLVIPDAVANGGRESRARQEHERSVKWFAGSAPSFNSDEVVSVWKKCAQGNT